MHAAVSLCAAAACLAGSVFCFRHRDGVLRIMTRLRGYDPPRRYPPSRYPPHHPPSRHPSSRHLPPHRPPPGPRRRYQRGPTATLDMLSPVVALLALALVFLVSGVLALR